MKPARGSRRRETIDVFKFLLGIIFGAILTAILHGLTAFKILHLPFIIIEFVRTAMLKIICALSKFLITLGFELLAQRIVQLAKFVLVILLWIIFGALYVTFALADYPNGLAFLENYFLPTFCVISLILLTA